MPAHSARGLKQERQICQCPCPGCRTSGNPLVQSPLITTHLQAVSLLSSVPWDNVSVCCYFLFFVLFLLRFFFLSVFTSCYRVRQSLWNRHDHLFTQGQFWNGHFVGFRAMTVWLSWCDPVRLKIQLLTSHPWVETEPPKTVCAEDFICFLCSLCFV